MTKPSENNTDEHSSSLLILVVEDTATARQYLLHALERLRLKGVAAETGEEALEKIKNHPVDGMLLDIALGPGISGVTLMEKLREQDQFKETPIIAVTAYAERVVDRVQKGAFDGFLRKPFLVKDLEEILKKYLPIT
jgi:CheY-like chemotaxis protein